MTDQETPTDLNRLHRLLDEGYPLRKVARIMSLSLSEVQAAASAYDAQLWQVERARNRVQWMVDRAYRSNLPVVLNTHTREFDPKVLRSEAYAGCRSEGAHCLPDGLPDPDYLRARLF